MPATLPWHPLAPFGAEVLADLSQPLSPEQARQFRELVWTHGVVIARGQHLTMACQRELCATLGPILLREGENGYLSNAAGIEASVSALAWHADAAYTDAPFDAIALHAVDIVDGASSTRFVDAAGALERLSPELRTTLRAATAEMVSPAMDRLADRTCDDEAPKSLKHGSKPAVRCNPHNGREAVWVSEMQTASIVGLDRAASRALLHAVFDMLYDPAHILAHVWHAGDFVVWDNIGTQHMRGRIADCGTRVLQRVIVGTAGVIPTLPDPAR